MKKVSVPVGESGEWKVERFTVSDESARRSFSQYNGRGVTPGTYTRLCCNGSVIMSDTPSEMSDHRAPVKEAKGHILINGLGLGMVLLNCLIQEKVERATVVELSQDVINLVGPHYLETFGDRLEIIHADAFEYCPPKGVRYGMVWHDIWPTISAYNHEGMKRLHHKYGRRANWQSSWCKAWVYGLAREEREDKRIRKSFFPEYDLSGQA